VEVRRRSAAAVWQPAALQRPALTLNGQDEALPDGRPEGPVGHAARKPPARVPRRRPQEEEGRQRVGVVTVAPVAGQQDVLEHLGERGAHPPVRRRRVLDGPDHLHVQRVVALRVAGDLPLAALLQREGGANVQGDAGGL